MNNDDLNISEELTEVEPKPINVGLNPYLLKQLELQRNKLKDLQQFQQTQNIQNPVNIIQQTNYTRTFNKIKDDEIPNGIVGLTNLGNTCYMNAILQCLINSPQFSKTIMNNDIIKILYQHISKTIDNENKNNISLILSKCQLTLSYQLYKLTNTAWSTNIKYIRPTNFRNIFSNKIENFKSYEQQDCQEALLCILDTIHTELENDVIINYDFINPEYLQLFDKIIENNVTDVEICAMESTYPDIWELFSVKKTLDRYNKKSYSIITQLFQTIISSTLQCPDCNYHTYNFDPSIIITVQIPNANIDTTEIDEKMEKLNHLHQQQQEHIKKQLIMRKIQEKSFTLNECFDNFCNTEILDDINQWHCPYCDNKVNAFKKCNIWIPPKLMIIQIKRFIHNISESGYSATKINNLIEYPINDFNINSYLSEFSKTLGNYNYDLYGVSNHIGGMNGGHYYSFVKSLENNKWYCLDDDEITEINNESDVISQHAYMLFYIQKE
jgi:ubiquitin carboxyl-terminal hydrolase 8